MLIGLEIEMHSNGEDIFSIMAKEGLCFETFRMKDGLSVKMSKEYYSTTIEYNFEPKQLTKLYLEKVKVFIEKQMNKHNLVITTKGPGYVGTHVHLFDLKFRKLKSNEILETTMSFINNNLYCLKMDSKRRIALSHQLWGNYVHYNFNDYHSICRNNGVQMLYPGIGIDKPKYNPYIISDRSTKGKPRSVEIRIIPNEFLFNGKLYKLLKKISDLDFDNIDINEILSNWVYMIRKN